MVEKIGVEVVVFMTDKKIEIKMSDRVNRSMISAVDAIVGNILAGKGKDLPRKFVEIPTGTLIGTQTIRIPDHMIWRPGTPSNFYKKTFEKKEQVVSIPLSAPPVKRDEAPTLAAVVRVTPKAVKKKKKEEETAVSV